MQRFSIYQPYSNWLRGKPFDTEGEAIATALQLIATAELYGLTGQAQYYILDLSTAKPFNGDMATFSACKYVSRTGFRPSSVLISIKLKNIDVKQKQ